MEYFKQIIIILYCFCFHLLVIDASDLFPECEYWASNGSIPFSMIRPTLSFFSKYRKSPPIILCHEKPKLMWSLCLRSCYKYSKDQHPSCPLWAKQGECMKNPEYMQVACAPSCGNSIAWNSLLRSDLGISNVTLNSNIIEKLLQPCQIPLNLLNVADILTDRLSLFLQGNYDYLWSLYLQTPLEYNTIIGVTEVYSYIFKIYEMVYRTISNDPASIKNITTHLANIQETLYDLQLSPATITDDSSFAAFPEFVDKVARKFPQWMDQLSFHYERIHELALSISSTNGNHQPPTKSSSSNSKLLTLNQCNEFKNLEISKINYFFYEECTQENHFCYDFHQVNSYSSKTKNSRSKTNLNDEILENQQIFKDENDLPIPIDQYSPNSLLEYIPLTQTLSNGIEIPVLGLGLNQPNIIENLQLILDGIPLGYRLIEITLDDLNLDLSIATTLQSLFQTNAVQRDELFIVLRYSNHSFVSETNEPVDYFLIIQDHIQQRLLDLALTYADLLILDTPPILNEERNSIWKGMELLYREGYVRSIGVGNFDSYALEELIASATIKPMVLYNKLDIYHYTTISSPLLNTIQEINALLNLVEDHNIVLIGYSPFSGYPYLLKPLYDPIINHIANIHTLLLHNTTTKSDFMNSNAYHPPSPSKQPSTHHRDAQTNPLPPDRQKEFSHEKDHKIKIKSKSPPPSEEKKQNSPMKEKSNGQAIPNNKDDKKSINNDQQHQKNSQNNLWKRRAPNSRNNNNKPNDVEIPISNSGEAFKKRESDSRTSDNSKRNSKLATEEATQFQLQQQQEEEEKFQQLSKTDIITPAQIILRYFLEQRMVIIFHSQSPEHLEENMKAFEILSLTDYERNLIESIQYMVGNYAFLRN